MLLEETRLRDARLLWSGWNLPSTATQRQVLTRLMIGRWTDQRCEQRLKEG